MSSTGSEGSDNCWHASLPVRHTRHYLLQTKKLWIDRLQREKKSLEQSSLPVPFAKPPSRICISYPFSSSPLLQEQVLPSVGVPGVMAKREVKA